MAETIPGRDSRACVDVGVIIPTYGRGTRVIDTVERIAACNPAPAEILVHIDASDGTLAGLLREHYPWIRIFESNVRRGPGGGRHVLLRECRQPFVASFDDDSYPYDEGFFFGEVVRIFEEQPGVAVIDSQVWARGEPVPELSSEWTRKATFQGGGHAVRLQAYRQIRGYLDRPIGYGMEEKDVGLQLYERDWTVIGSRSLRVFHDTDLTHRDSREVVAGSIRNVLLFCALHYPLRALPTAVLQIVNTLFYHLRRFEIVGVILGLLGSVRDIPVISEHRRAVSWDVTRGFVELRRQRESERKTRGVVGPEKKVVL